MKHTLLAAACLTALAACSSPTPPDKAQSQTSAPTTSAPATAPAPKSGIDLNYIDNTVRIQDDYYQHVNGKWLATVEIPADKPSYGTGAITFDKIQDDLHSVIDDAAAGKSTVANVDTKKIGDLYSSFMDEAALEALDIKPLAPYFADIDALKDSKGIPALITRLNRSVGSVTPYGIASNAPVQILIHQDNKDATQYIVDFEQGGLGLPDRDYYLKDDDAKLKGIRDEYRKHIDKMLGMAGDKNSAADATQIVALETALAKIQWDKVALRDPIKAYNKQDIAKLGALAPGFDWDAFADTIGIKGKVDSVIVGQPTYLTGFAKLVEKPLATWKAYFRWRVLSDFAPALSKRFDDESFAFNGTVLRGVPQNRARWKRGISLINAGVGEELGKLYTAKYFPADSKARAQKLVGNLLAAFKQGIDNLDWMTPQTKQAAQEKLAKFTPKIGYPETWRDYSTLTIDKGDLVGNISRAADFEYQRNLSKLGKPIDRGEWGMTPQTLNAYYNPELNEIVFPAAILQPPYFDPTADDAVNYGGIAAIIGHEISHGFDDQGAQYDGDGNLRDWWTKEDHEKFAAKTKALVVEYSAFEPVAGYHLNGELTLGENIADNSGLAVAYKAYQISLGGKPAPVIDNLTGDQRFYLGFAQVWRAKARDNATIAQIKSDPHSIPKYRAMGTVVNQPAFFTAFDVKEGDKMWRGVDQRVIIW